MKIIIIMLILFISISFFSIGNKIYFDAFNNWLTISYSGLENIKTNINNIKNIDIISNSYRFFYTDKEYVQAKIIFYDEYLDKIVFNKINYNKKIKKFNYIHKNNNIELLNVIREFYSSGKEIKKTYIDDKFSKPLIILYEYDSKNNLIKQEIDDGEQKNSGKKIFPTNHIFVYNISYNNLDKIEEVRVHYEIINNESLIKANKYIYDNDKILIEIDEYYNSGYKENYKEKIKNICYFDKNENLIKIIHFITNESAKDHEEYNYKYDDNKNLIEYIKYNVEFNKIFLEKEKEIFEYNTNNQLINVKRYKDKKLVQTENYIYQNDFLIRFEQFDSKDKLLMREGYSYKFNEMNDINQIIITRNQNKKEIILLYEYYYEYY